MNRASPAPRLRPRQRAAGFTLIELMVAVLVASILFAVAVPSYLSQVRKSRRVDAKTALLDLAGREERFFNTNNAYTTLAVNLGYAAAGSAATVTNLPVGSSTNYYQVTVTVPAAALPAPSYQITATPLTADQLKDTTCASFSIDSTGTQSALSSTGVVTTTSCW